MGFTNYGYRSISESSIDNEVPLYLSGANKQAVSRVAPAAEDGGGDVFADELRQEHAGRKIVRFGYGPASSPTWVTQITGNGMEGRFYDTGGYVINARAYAPSGDPFSVGVGAHTEADSQALDAAVADLRAQQQAMGAIAGDGRYVHLHIPAGTWNLSHPLNLTGLVGTLITGDGVQSTRIGLNHGPGASSHAQWAGWPMVDISASNFVRLANIAIAPDNSQTTSLIPETGLLMAQDVGNTCNANYLDTVRVAGAFIKACHVNYATPSSIYVRCAFFRVTSNNPSYPIGTNQNQACVIFTRDNQVGAHGAPGAPALAGISTGVSCSDLTLVDCEINDLVNGGSGNCGCPALWLDEVYDWRMYGGNISGHGAPTGYVRMSPGAAGTELIGCRNIAFDGVFFYTEGGGLNAQIGIRVTGNNADNALILRSHVESWPNDSDTLEIAASDVTIVNCQMSLTNGGGAIGGGRIDSAATTEGESPHFIRWTVQNLQTRDTGHPQWHVNAHNQIALFGGGDKGFFRFAAFDCNGLGIATNGGRFDNPIRLAYPGTITNTTISHGDRLLSGGGDGFVLAAGGTAYYGAGGAANSSEPLVMPIRVSAACRLFNLRVCSFTAPSGAATLTCTVRKATPSTTLTYADTALVATITGTSVTGSQQGTYVDAAAGDILLLRVVASAGAANQNWLSWSLSAIAI